MRFIHKHPGGKVGLDPGSIDVFTRQQKKLPTTAVFSLGYLHPWEIKAARERFLFRGTTVSGDPGNPGQANDPIPRVAYYDTVEEQRAHGWTDEHREEIESKLLNHKFHGIDFIHVEAPELVAPWPKYDELVSHGRRTPQMVAEKIAEKVREDGYDVAHVVAYERAKRNRQEVINALLGIEETDEDVVEVVA